MPLSARRGCGFFGAPWGEISGEAKRSKEITCPLSDAAAREPTHMPAHAGKGEISPNHPRSLPCAGERMERLPANSSAVPQGTRRTSQSGARSQPGVRGLSLFKGVIRNAAGVLHGALANTELHPADGVAGEEGRTFVLHTCGQPGGWPVAPGTRGAGLRVGAGSRLGAGSIAAVRGCLGKGRAGASAQPPSHQNSMDGNAHCFIRCCVPLMCYNSLL